MWARVCRCACAGVGCLSNVMSGRVCVCVLTRKMNQNRKCILSHCTLQKSHAKKARLPSTYGIKME